MRMSIYVKSGTGEYFDYEGCDYLVKEIKNANFPIPRVHETIELLEPNDEKRTNHLGDIINTYYQYLVTDIIYMIDQNDECGVKIYVVPIGRNKFKQ